MVTSVASSRDSDFTPAGSLMSDRCSEWLISSAPTSASMYCGMLSTEHSSSMVWVTMLTVPPRLTPGDASAVHDVQGNADADGGAFAEPHEIDMDREVAHRIEMEVARNHAVLLALEIDVVNRGQEPAGQDALAQFGIVDRDGDGGLVVAIDHSGHSPGATLCPGGPLAALRTCGRLQFLDGRHCLKSLFSKKLKAASRPGSVHSKPPGVRGLRTWRAFSPKGRK